MQFVNLTKPPNWNCTNRGLLLLMLICWSLIFNISRKSTCQNKNLARLYFIKPNFHHQAFYHLMDFFSFVRVAPGFVSCRSDLCSFCLALGWTSKWFRKSLCKNGKNVKSFWLCKEEARTRSVKIKGRQVLPNWLFGHDCSCHCRRCWITTSIDISG